uniref:Vesicle coat complex copii subunit sec24/subunit sfb2 n=1 Tax=Angiostrongylus cantonensis TaxID=6313 RepID=A0A0K0CX93_ANGCA
MFAPPFPPSSGGRPEIQPTTASFLPQSIGAANDSQQTTQFGTLPKPFHEPLYGYPTGCASPTQPSMRNVHPGPAPQSSPYQPTVPAVNGITSSAMSLQSSQTHHLAATNGLQSMQNHNLNSSQNSQHIPLAVPPGSGTASALTNKSEPSVSVGRQRQDVFPGQSIQQLSNAVHPTYQTYGTTQQVQQISSFPSQPGPFQSPNPPHPNQLQQPQVDARGHTTGVPGAPLFPPPIGAKAHPDFPNMSGASTAMANSQDGFQSPGPPEVQPHFGAAPNVQRGIPPSVPGYPQGPGFPSAGFPSGPPMHTRQPQPQPQQRLDPNMMPSAVEVMEIDSAQSGQFPTGYPHANPPPLVSTDFYAVDQGNCSPRLMRSTLYMAPASNDLLKTAQIPFAVACSPFATLHPNERAPPLIDLGPGGPVRCQRCKAYMCPFMEFQDGGRRFRCPFCHASTPVEDVYFAHLDHTGRRTDIEHRPELFLGAYEFIATKQYCKNGLPPKEPAFIFMVDVSYNAIQNGMLQVVCSHLERILQQLPKDLGASESVVHVGLAAFDQVVHFFDLSAAQPSVMVVGDVGDMFVPIVDGLLLPYSQAAQSIRAVLAEIPRLFAQSKITETLLGPVVQAGLDALQCADRVGKLMVFSTSLPTFEAPGKLKARNERSFLGTEKEKVVRNFCECLQK